MNAYVAGAYAATTGTIVLYAWRVIRRGRALSNARPEEEQTWQ